MATLKYLGASFFYVPVRIPAHFKFPSKCHRLSPMRELRRRYVDKKIARITTECETLARLLKHYGSFSTFNRIRFLYRDSAFAPCGGIAFLERPSSSLPMYPGESLVIIDFTIMHCPVASQLMHVQRPDWMRFDGHY